MVQLWLVVPSTADSSSNGTSVENLLPPASSSKSRLIVPNDSTATATSISTQDTNHFQSSPPRVDSSKNDHPSSNPLPSENFNISDSQLKDMTSYQLNRKIHGVSINTKRHIKNRRRKLLNRHYALQSRLKKICKMGDLERTNTELKQKLEEVQKGKYVIGSLDQSA